MKKSKLNIVVTSLSYQNNCESINDHNDCSAELTFVTPTPATEREQLIDSLVVFLLKRRKIQKVFVCKNDPINHPIKITFKNGHSLWITSLTDDNMGIKINITGYQDKLDPFGSRPAATENITTWSAIIETFRAILKNWDPDKRPVITNECNRLQDLARTKSPLKSKLQFKRWNSN